MPNPQHRKQKNLHRINPQKGCNKAAKPDVVRGLEKAEGKGWIEIEIDTELFRGLNVLVSWIYSGGSISKRNLVPYFVIDDEEDRELLERVGDVVGVEFRKSREASVKRSAELVPQDLSTTLGRVLKVLGAPVGRKHGEKNMRLPTYLDKAPGVVGREFLKIYFRNRGAESRGKDTVVIREERPYSYLREFANLVEELCGGEVSVSDKNVIIRADLARQIRSWKPVLH